MSGSGCRARCSLRCGVTATLDRWSKTRLFSRQASENASDSCRQKTGFWVWGLFVFVLFGGYWGFFLGGGAVVCLFICCFLSFNTVLHICKTRLMRWESRDWSRLASHLSSPIKAAKPSFSPSLPSPTRHPNAAALLIYRMRTASQRAKRSSSLLSLSLLLWQKSWQKNLKREGLVRTHSVKMQSITARKSRLPEYGVRVIQSGSVRKRGEIQAGLGFLLPFIQSRTEVHKITPPNGFSH